MAKLAGFAAQSQAELVRAVSLRTLRHPFALLEDLVAECALTLARPGLRRCGGSGDLWTCAGNGCRPHLPARTQKTSATGPPRRFSCCSRSRRGRRHRPSYRAARHGQPVHADPHGNQRAGRGRHRPHRRREFRGAGHAAAPGGTAGSDQADAAGLAPLVSAPGSAAHSGPFPVTWAALRNGHTTGSAEVEGRDTAPSPVDQPELQQGSWVRPGGVVVEVGFADTSPTAPYLLTWQQIRDGDAQTLGPDQPWRAAHRLDQAHAGSTQ
jgi:hypothetical protein